MVIIVTSINLILTHQIFVGMTLKFNKQRISLNYFYFYPEVETDNVPQCATIFKMCVLVFITIIYQIVSYLKKIHVVLLFVLILVVVTTLYHKELDNFFSFMTRSLHLCMK